MPDLRHQHAPFLQIGVGGCVGSCRDGRPIAQWAIAQLAMWLPNQFVQRVAAQSPSSARRRGCGIVWVHGGSSLHVLAPESRVRGARAASISLTVGKLGRRATGSRRTSLVCHSATPIGVRMWRRAYSTSNLSFSRHRSRPMVGDLLQQHDVLPPFLQQAVGDLCSLFVAQVVRHL